MKTLSDVIDVFKGEYSFIETKFDVLKLSIKDALSDGSNEVNRPGVYIFWLPSHGVIKVGKSQSNSKKRALEHLRDNTQNNSFEMSSLGCNSNAKLLLLNIKKDQDIHWILSLEAFMEWNVSPIIKAARMG